MNALKSSEEYQKNNLFLLTFPWDSRFNTTSLPVFTVLSIISFPEWRDPGYLVSCCWETNPCPRFSWPWLCEFAMVTVPLWTQDGGEASTADWGSTADTCNALMIIFVDAAFFFFFLNLLLSHQPDTVTGLSVLTPRSLSWAAIAGSECIIVPVRSRCLCHFPL